jgi:hypothetical protein
MKSGQKELIGPGSNSYSRDPKPEIDAKLTPELADKIFKSVQKRLYDEKVSKEAVLHHLKKLKAQMGRYKNKIDSEYSWVVTDCMEMITNKIKKINK